MATRVYVRDDSGQFSEVPGGGTRKRKKLTPEQRAAEKKRKAEEAARKKEEREEKTQTRAEARAAAQRLRMVKANIARNEKLALAAYRKYLKAEQDAAKPKAKAKKSKSKKGTRKKSQVLSL